MPKTICTLDRFEDETVRIYFDNIVKDGFRENYIKVENYNVFIPKIWKNDRYFTKIHMSCLFSLINLCKSLFSRMKLVFHTNSKVQKVKNYDIFCGWPFAQIEISQVFTRMALIIIIWGNYSRNDKACHCAV